MKIAIVVGKFPKLSETFILNQITGLIDLGHKVHIYARSKSADRIIQKEVRDYKLVELTNYFFDFSKLLKNFMKIIRFIVIKFFKNPIVFLKSLKYCLYEKYSHPLEKIFLPLEKLFLASNFFENDYDVIHFHFGKVGKFSAYLKKIGIKSKMITTFYGSDITKRIKRHGIDYYDGLFKSGDLFLPICNYFKSLLINLGCNNKKIIVHPLGIDVNKVKISNKKKNIEKNQINIFSVGRLTEKKGFEYSIKAFSKIKAKQENIIYKIVGDGELLPELKNLVKELRIKDSIQFLGAQEHRKVIKLFGESDIFVLTSVTARNGDKEGTPTVLLEAMSMCLPVISTIHSGIPEIVMDGKTGFLVPERNIDRLKEKLEYLINNSEKRQEMGRNGRKFVEDNFDIKKLNVKLISIYKSIL
ncbi:MAG: glycosyltransferase [Promethearchaeota archaeon]